MDECTLKRFPFTEYIAVLPDPQTSRLTVPITINSLMPPTQHQQLHSFTPKIRGGEGGNNGRAIGGGSSIQSLHPRRLYLNPRIQPQPSPNRAPKITILSHRPRNPGSIIHRFTLTIPPAIANPKYIFLGIFPLFKFSLENVENCEIVRRRRIRHVLYDFMTGQLF